MSLKLISVIRPRVHVLYHLFAKSSHLSRFALFIKMDFVRNGSRAIFISCHEIIYANYQLYFDSFIVS